MGERQKGRLAEGTGDSESKRAFAKEHGVVGSLEVALFQVEHANSSFSNQYSRTSEMSDRASSESQLCLSRIRIRIRAQ
jgi:hypothetical protein